MRFLSFLINLLLKPNPTAMQMSDAWRADLWREEKHEWWRLPR